MDKLYSKKSLKDERFVEQIISHETSNPQSAYSFKCHAAACVSYLASQIKHAKAWVIPHAAHIIQLEQPKYLYDILKDLIMHYQKNLQIKLGTKL